MSIKLELIAVAFPLTYNMELIKCFLQTNDKIKYNEKLHFKQTTSEIPSHFIQDNSEPI